MMMALPAAARVTVFFLLAALCLGQSRRAWAGACDDTEKEGLNELEKLGRGEMRAEQMSSGMGVLCLLGQPVSPWNHKWAGKGAQRTFAALRGDKALARKVSRICKRTLAGKHKDGKRICLVLLASFGIEKVAEHSVLGLSKDLFPCGLPPDRLALLGGAEAARAVEAQWTQDSQTYCGFNGCACAKMPKAQRKQASFMQDHKFDVLNALWHIADPQSREWIGRVAGQDEDPKVAARAEKVLKHIASQSR